MCRFAAIVAIWLGMLGGAALAQTCPKPPVPPHATAVAWPAPQKHPEVLALIERQLGSGKNFGALALGDSIMRGWPPSLLDQAMGTRTLNAGVGGDGSGRVLWKLDTLDWSRQHPRDILVLVGTNDLRRPPCDVYWGVRTVVGRAHALFPQARVIVTSILPRGDRLLEFDDRIATVNAALREGAAERDYVLFDVHDRLLCGHVTPCNLFQDNLLHLTRDGYDVLSAALSDLLRAQPASR